MSEKRKYLKSKEEIAREFDLPERKSKIATIMKQDGQAYCICRSSDCSRFMIGCDGCEEWYHGDCINITEKEAKHIKQYFCQRCKEEDPSLQTVFRVVPVEKTSTPAGSSAADSETMKRKKANKEQKSVLPQRIQEWNLSSCRAEEENKKQLDSIRSKQSMVRFALDELDKRHAELDLIVERAKHSTLDSSRHQDSSDVEDEQSMYCITCGHEIHSRTAIKHMEKCFNKYESQASFGSIFKTRIEGSSMFCDFFNPASKTYCKRLRVLCPEHCKDPKVNDNDVCGCPLVTDVFNPTGEFCRAPKKSCFKHYVWEKIRRAEIDLERVRQWLKMDELLEQERQIRHLMASRAGVLGLMLHSTYNHEVMEELCRQQQQQIAAVHKQKQQLKEKKEQELMVQQQKKQEKQQQQHKLQQQKLQQQKQKLQQQQQKLQQQQQKLQQQQQKLQQQKLQQQKLQQQKLQQQKLQQQKLEQQKQQQQQQQQLQKLQLQQQQLQKQQQLQQQLQQQRQQQLQQQTQQPPQKQNVVLNSWQRQYQQSIEEQQRKVLQRQQQLNRNHQQQQ